jgi:hypothetical protein
MGLKQAVFNLFVGQTIARRTSQYAFDRTGAYLDYPAMNDVIYPRSPRETMCDWVHLPRFVDKIRLHLAGKLHADYQENFTRGFDGAWLKHAGIPAEQLIEVVKNSITDGQVADWVLKNVKKTDAEKSAFCQYVLKRGTEGGEVTERLKMRKEQAGLSDRDDLKTFVDYIDADEKRL